MTQLHRMGRGLTVTASIVILCSCGGGGGGGNAGGGGSPPPQNDALWPSTVQLLSGSAHKVTAKDDNSVTLTGIPENVSVGNVVISDQLGGFVRRVASITRARGETVLHTSPATLSDAYERATFELDRTVPGGDYEMLPTAEGIKLSVGKSRARGFSVDPVRVEFLNFQLKDKTGSKLSINGSAQLQLRIELLGELDLKGAKSARFVPTLTLDADLIATATRRLEFEEQQIPIPFAELVGPPITILPPVVPVPLTVVPKIKLFTHAVGEIEVGAGLHAKGQLTLAAGIGYSRDDRGWYPIISTQPDLTWGIQPVAFVTTSGTVTPVRAEVSLKVYDLAGPYAILDLPGIDVSLRSQNQPPGINVTLESFIRGGAGFVVDVFGFKQKYENPNLFSVQVDTKELFFGYSGNGKFEIK